MMLSYAVDCGGECARGPEGAQPFPWGDAVVSADAL
jgi:hypothetical protein